MTRNVRSTAIPAQLHSGKPTRRSRHFVSFLSVAIAVTVPGFCLQISPVQAKPSMPPEAVGYEACATCHEELAKKFANNPHSKMWMARGPSGVTCESCHGNGKAHAESNGDPAKIVNPAKAPAPDVNKTCLRCHAAHLAEFSSSVHAKQNLSCLSCHSIHMSNDQSKLLKASQPALCAQCHSSVMPQFLLASHHSVSEHGIQCSGCHDPHATAKAGSQRDISELNATCLRCHTKMNGPFTYEHQAISAEGCLSCHSPHGSPNPHLLKVGDINTLCLLCHSISGSTISAHPVISSGAQHSQTAQTSQCTDCHTRIHGSNFSKALLK